MKPHESPRINKKSIRDDSGDSWPVWNRGITDKSLSGNDHTSFTTAPKVRKKKCKNQQLICKRNGLQNMTQQEHADKSMSM